MVKRSRLLALAGSGLLVLAACGQAATPTPTLAPQTPTRAAVAATPTRAPGATIAPTPTAAPLPTPTRAASAGPKYGGRLTFALDSPVNWNSLFVTENSGHHVPGFIYNRLQERNSGPPACALYPLKFALAESWRWVDETTFEIKVRSGVRFHNRPPVNGREVTAQDVIWNLTKPGGTAVGKAIVDIPRVISRAEAVDKYTARFYLVEPYAIFPGRIGHDRNHIYAPEAVGEDLALARPEEHVGTGPFVFKSERMGVSAVLERNPDYWDKGLPYLDELNALVMTDSSSQMAAFRSGRLDLVIRPPAPLAAPLKKLSAVTSQSCGDQPSHPLALRSDKPPFNDVRVRRAVALALDQEALIRTAMGGEAVRVYSVFPFYGHPAYMKLEDYPPEVRKNFEYNPEEAKRLLAEAGYPNGIETVYNPGFWVYPTQIAEAVTAMLGKVGIKAEIKPFELAAWSVRRRGLNFEGITQIIVGPEPPFEQVTRHYDWEKGEPNWSLFGYRNETVLRLIRQGVASRDAEEQNRVLRELQVIFARDMFNIPMPNPKVSLFTYDYVKNVSFKPFYLYNISEYMYQAWVDK